MNVLQIQNQNREEYQGKVEDERKRIAYLMKEIKFLETEMINSPGYHKVFELEKERKNLRKQINDQNSEI